mmetsp:Transcript_86393/g.244912  ORF Transcript_86393/g.244912 Transcript_86393/m.244912 type:complete len:204 (-) Transcript_86393:524-1135(-)
MLEACSFMLCCSPRSSPAQTSAFFSFSSRLECMSSRTRISVFITWIFRSRSRTPPACFFFSSTNELPRRSTLSSTWLIWWPCFLTWVRVSATRACKSSRFLSNSSAGLSRSTSASMDCKAPTCLTIFKFMPAVSSSTVLMCSASRAILPSCCWSMLSNLSKNGVIPRWALSLTSLASLCASSRLACWLHRSSWASLISANSFR